MLDSFRRWLTGVRLSNPVHQRQAGLLQAMLLIIIAACVLGLPLNIQTANEAMALLPLILYPLLLVTSIVALALLRRDHFTASVNTITVGMALAIGIALIGAGFDRSELILIAFCVPSTMAGLLAGHGARRAGPNCRHPARGGADDCGPWDRSKRDHKLLQPAEAISSLIQRQ